MSDNERIERIERWLFTIVDSLSDDFHLAEQTHIELLEVFNEIYDARKES